jgi:hypothetical protein
MQFIVHIDIKTILSRPDFFSLCPEKGTKKLAVSSPVAVSAEPGQNTGYKN